MKELHRILLAATTGILLSAGWYEWGTGLLLLVAFIPLLLVEDDLTRFGEVKNARKVYLYAVLAIFIWNVITTWWIKNASLVGLVAAVVVSTLYMSLAV